MMKKSILVLMSAMVLIGCQEMSEDSFPTEESKPFTAIVEDFDSATKTSLAGLNQIVWSAGDRIAIFQGCNVADKYLLAEASAGTGRGEFVLESDRSHVNDDFSSGMEITANIAVYPYADDLDCEVATVHNSASQSEVKAYKVQGLTIPTVQNYAENSFGPETFPMVAVTKDMADHVLKFKNLMGVLKLQLKGTEKVKIVKVEGKMNEKLSGDVIVNIPLDNTPPTLTMAENAATYVQLDCGSGVQLNESSATAFYISLPPVLFTQGFRVTITYGDGNTKELEAVVANEIKRSSILSMPAYDPSEDEYEEHNKSITKGPITLSLGTVTTTTATFNAKIDVDMMADYTEVGFVFSEEDELDVESSTCTSVKITKSTYSEIISGLPYDTDLYYTVYLVKNGMYIYGDVESFRTLLPDIRDLSEVVTANCYIVSGPGLYKFRPTKGNGTELAGSDSDLHPVGEISTAEVLWKSFGNDVRPEFDDLVQDEKVEYKDGFVCFQTSKLYQEGNAVIAVKDADEMILWSWHIWLTDEPAGQEYSNNAGIMMDRNLGATSADPGDIGALGLLYQWGRKDPFLCSSSISNATEAKSTITWPARVESTSKTGTIEYAVSHPTTFIIGNSSKYDWYYTGTANIDNTRWNTSASEKSIYDPCPAGWRVPDGGSAGIWSKAHGASSRYEVTYDGTNEGVDFSGDFGTNQTIWFPAAGYRSSNDGSLTSVGLYGSCWSATPNGSHAYYLSFDYNGYVYPSDYSNRADGFSVRCLQE